MEEPRKGRAIAAWILAGGLAALGGVYWFWRRDLEKREKNLPPPSRGAGPAQESPEEARRRLEETLKAVEQTRRLNQPNTPGLPPQDPTAGVQKTLKTVEEINRINRMNQEFRQRQRSDSPPAPPSSPK